MLRLLTQAAISAYFRVTSLVIRRDVDRQLAELEAKVGFIRNGPPGEIVAHDARATEQSALLQERHGDDAQRIQQEMDAWRAANPAPNVPLTAVADHIEHIRDVAGIDHVGLGSDFDGIPTYVDGLEDVSTFPALLIELARRGWSDDDLRKVAGENILRVMRDAEAAARRLQRSREPSTRRMPDPDVSR